MTGEERRKRQREASARYRAHHPDEVRERVRLSARRRRAADPAAARAYDRAYKEANPAIYVASAAQGRARRASAPGRFSQAEWTTLLEEFDYRCAYCQATGIPLEREHMTPLIRGGAHAAHNIVPACTSCNRRKGTLTALEFLGRTSSSLP